MASPRLLDRDLSALNQQILAQTHTPENQLTRTYLALTSAPFSSNVLALTMSSPSTAWQSCLFNADVAIEHPRRSAICDTCISIHYRNRNFKIDLKFRCCPVNPAAAPPPKYVQTYTDRQQTTDRHSDTQTNRKTERLEKGQRCKDNPTNWQTTKTINCLLWLETSWRAS